VIDCQFFRLPIRAMHRIPFAGIADEREKDGHVMIEEW